MGSQAHHFIGAMVMFSLIGSVAFPHPRPTGAASSQAEDRDPTPLQLPPDGLPSAGLAQAVATGRVATTTTIRDSSTPGVGVAVGLGGRIVWDEGFGLADIEKGSPVTKDTKFGIGSISKALTTALIGRLTDQGLVDLDAPLERYLPDFPHAGRGITVRLVAAHLSGIDDITERELYHTTRHFPTTRQALEVLWHDPVVHEPGTVPQYATGTYTLLAGVVEAVTRKSFLKAMDDEVLTPLGLASTVANQRRVVIAHRTSFYARDQEGTVVNAPCFDPSFKWAGAGFLATAGDVARFGMALASPGFLSERAWKEILTPVCTPDGVCQFALGWSVQSDEKGRQYFARSGGGPGIRGILLVYPENDLVVSILSNLTRAPVGGELSDIIVEAFLHQ